MRHFVIKAAVWLLLVAVTFTVLKLSPTVTAALATFAAGYAIARIADFVADAFAPQEPDEPEMCPVCAYVAAGNCSDCQTFRTGETR